MNILVVSLDLSGGGLAFHLKKEGHDVRLFVEEDEQRQNYEGLVDKVLDWKKELDWVGKEGLIVFDSCGLGKEQDELRKAGFSVVGGCELGDKLEHDRQYGQKIFSACNVPVVSSIGFFDIEKAIEFVSQNIGPWVVKQNGHLDKALNYVGSLQNGEDVIDVLRGYDKYEHGKLGMIDLQKRVDGIEIGVARYFNGFDWIGPIEINFEHKDLFAGNLGPKTYEMGTLMWFTEDENNKLFQATLSRMTAYLKSINFRGDIDMNCIVDGDKLYPLEVTTRFGWPATHLHCELFLSPMGEFLKAVADGKQYDLKYKKEFGVAILVATPPFPYQIGVGRYSSMGKKIYFNEQMNHADFDHVYFEDVSRNNDGHYYISSHSGFILHVTNSAKRVCDARQKCIEIIDKLIIPKKFYRNDIGLKFEKYDSKVLESHGWIRKPTWNLALLTFATDFFRCCISKITRRKQNGFRIVFANRFSKKYLESIKMLERMCFPSDWQYEDVENYYKGKLADSENINVFLMENCDIIGYALASFHNKEFLELSEYDHDFTKQENVFYIETLQVLPEKSGRGGASQLLRALCLEANKRGINHFSIHARKLNGLNVLVKKLFSGNIIKIREIESWTPAQGEQYEYIEWNFLK